MINDLQNNKGMVVVGGGGGVSSVRKCVRARFCTASNENRRFDELKRRIEAALSRLNLSCTIALAQIARAK